MNAQDKVERVLKEMHVLFAKSPTYNGEADKMILSRSEFLALMDRLNAGIYDMMEEYEQTRQSRQSAERSFRKTGDEIIEKANANAEDVYAASVIYTTDAIGRIRDLMDQTNNSMNEMFRQFRTELKEQKDTLRRHESELRAQLSDLSDTKKYLGIIRDINRERERRNRDLEAERETGSRYARATFHPGVSSARVQVNSAYFEKEGAAAPAEASLSDAPLSVEKPEVIVNENAAYFKWKQARENGGQIPEDAAAEAVTEELLAEDRAVGEEPGRDDSAAEADFSPEEMPTEVLSADEQPQPAMDEAAIYAAVLADERAAEAARAETDSREKPRAGALLKTIIFGKDSQ